MPNRKGPSRAPGVPQATSLPPWGALCFFASGAAGLLYEVVWSKELSYLLGNSLHAVATVVAAFLGGLALGARFLGPALGRRSDGARVYAGLEIGVAVLGVISLPVLRGLDPVVGVLYRSFGGEGAAFAVARFALVFTLLVPPALLMGATLPVLVTRFERGRVGPTMAWLYAVNTLGAVAGTFAGGFVLLPSIGLSATTWVAAALNAAAAITAWAASRHDTADVAHVRRAQESPADETSLAGGIRVAFAILFLLSGFTALTYQIAWVRIFTLVFGSSVYSFSAVLGVYLLGLALGSAAVAPLLRRGASLAGFGLLQLALAAAAAFQLTSFSRIPQWTYDLVQGAGTSWGRLVMGEVGLLAAFLLVPCALLGAAFPIAARLLQRRDAGEAAGLGLAVNTVGTIAGSLVAGFVAIPTLGVQATHVFTVCLSATIGAAALVLAYARREAAGRDLAIGAATVLAVLAFAVLAPRWEPSLMSAGIYRPVQAMNIERAAAEEPGEGSLVRRAANAERVLYYGEGINGSVLVGTDDDGNQRWLRVGGKVDASTGVKDMETQVLLGLVPAACADSNARALVIGLGSGVTVSAVLAAGAGPTDVVELEPRVVEASRFFHADGEHPLDDPRVHLVLGDARTLLAHGARRYGLIVSEPSNPWIAGVNNLFTVDFYRRVRTRLEPSGVFCQWIQMYELSPRTVASMIASFLAVFPDGQAFEMGQNADLMLVAAPPSRRLALDRLRACGKQPVLARAGIKTPEAVAAYYAAPFAALRGFVAGAPLNRDDLPIVEYRAPRDLVTIGRSGATLRQVATEMIPFTPAMPSGPWFADWTPDQWYEARTRAFTEDGEVYRAQATARAAGDAGLTALARRLSGEITAGTRRHQAIQEAERARELLAAGREDEGQQVLQNAAAIDPTNGRIWLWIADRRRLAGDFAGAERYLARVRADRDTVVQADAALIAGMLEFDRQHPFAAAARFRQVQKWTPDREDGYVYEARARAAAGDSAGARAAIERGLERLPGQSDLTGLLATMGHAP
jgi:spermidine synthase